jgi:hypothetical protein
MRKLACLSGGGANGDLVGRRIGGGRDYGGGLAGRESKVRFPLIAFVVVFLPPLLIVWLFLKNWFF